MQKIDLYKSQVIHRRFLSSEDEFQLCVLDGSNIYYKKIDTDYWTKIAPSGFNLKDLDLIIDACISERDGYKFNFIVDNPILKLEFECHELIKKYTWTIELYDFSKLQLELLDKIIGYLPIAPISSNKTNDDATKKIEIVRSYDTTADLRSFEHAMHISTTTVVEIINFLKSTIVKKINEMNLELKDKDHEINLLNKNKYKSPLYEKYKNFTRQEIENLKISKPGLSGSEYITLANVAWNNYKRENGIVVKRKKETLFKKTK